MRKITNSVICMSLFAALLLGGCASQEPADVTDKIESGSVQGNTEAQASESETETGIETGTETGTVTENASGIETAKQDIVYPPVELPGDDVKPIDWESGENPTGEQLKFASRTYDFSDEYYGNNIVLDGFGNSKTATDIYVSEIYDVLTGELAFYSAYHKTYTPIEEDGYTSYNISQFSRVYSTDGTLLIDWEEVEFGSAVGDWILMTPYFDMNYSSPEADWSGKLVNTKTGEVMDGVYEIDGLDDTHVFANREDGLFYILDKDGNITKNSDEYKQLMPFEGYAYTYMNYIVAKKQGDNLCDVYFFKPDGSLSGYLEGVEDTYIYDDMLIAPYISVGYQIYDLSKGDGGELVPVCDSSEKHYAAYYDGEIAVYRDEDGLDSCNDYLYNLSTKKQVSKVYREIQTVDKFYLGAKKNEPVQYFYGRTDDGVDKLDREGNVVSHISIPNLYEISVHTYGIDCDYDFYEHYYLLDLDLNVRETGKYEGVSPIYCHDGNDSDYSGWYVGYYSLDEEHYQSRYDILDANFEPVVIGASRVGSIVGGTLPVTRGQSIGVMDLKGNWLIKYDKNDFTNAD